MADAAELIVRIRGDASDLEATISSVESELSKLEQTQSKNNNTSTKGLTAYKKQMQDAQTTLQTSRTALTNTKKAYEDNVKSVNKNVTALKAQKTELDKQISLRSNEKRLLTEANKGLDKNSVAYKDNQKALNWVNTEIEAYTKQSQSISDSIRTQEAALSGSKKAYTDAQATVKKATEQYEEYEKGLKAAERADEAQNLQNTGKRWKEVGEGIDTVTKPLQYAATALAAGGVASAKFAIDFEDNFANVKKTVDGTPEQLEKIRQEIIDMTTVGINGHSAIPETTAELTELAAAGGQLGIKTENISKFTETMAMLGTATNLYGEEGAATLAKFANVTKMDQENFDRLGSSIVDLGNNFATTESDIANMSMRLAGAGTQIGLSQADILGIATALSSVGIEAEMGGSAFSKAMIAMQMATTNGYTQVNDVMNKTGMSLRDLQLLSANNSKDFKSLADGLGYTSTELNSMISSGVQLENFAKITGKTTEEFKNLFDSSPAEAIDAFIKGLQNADGAGENAISMLQDMGFTEVRLRDSLLRLANSEAGITEAVTRSNTAWNENIALQNEFNAKNETTASQLSVTKNNIVEAARSIGETMLPSIKDASTTVADFAKGLSQMDDEQKRAVVNTGATVIALGALSKVGVGVIKGAGDFVEGLGVISDKLPIIADATSAIKVSTAGLGSSFSALAPIFGAVLAPAAVVAGYKVVADHVTEAIENNAKLGQSYKELYSQWQDADNQVSHLENLRSEYEKLNESINSGTLNPEELESAKNRINDIMQEIKATTNDDTIKLMIDTGEFDTALAMAVSNAKDSANEIKDALDLTSGKKAQKAVSEGYDALQKGSSYGADYKNQQEEMRGWLQQATDYKTQYKAIVDEMNAAYKDGSSERIKAAALERQSFINGLKDSDFTKAYERFTGSTFKFGDVDEVIQEIQNVSNAYREISDNIESMDERAKNGRESLQAMAEVATTDAMNLNGFKDMQEVFESGGNAVDLVCKQIKSTMTDLGFENQDIAAQVALFKNGFQDLQGAINNNALDAVVNDFVKQGKEIGLTSEEIVTKAALMKNGFSDIQQAVASGDVSGLVKDLSSLGGDLGLSTEQVDALAHSLGLLPEDKHIEIDASGDVSAIENAKNAVEEINNAGNVQLQVSAEGDISVLDTADSKLQELISNNQVTITFNVDTGGFDINDLGGNKLGEITADGKINWEKGDVEKPENEKADGTIDYKLGDVAKPENAVATGTINYTLGTVATPNGVPKAKGTQNFEGGLAMVNDEKGISDPRELIIDKGRAFIPQGKDVVLPLSKGAKVYTASQTKAIMNGMGIPHYATGKDNSDAFTSAKDDWTHYTKTHAVTTAQELEKWLEFQEKFKSNDKDIADIEEQIFSIMQKQTKEFNEQSKAYLEKHSAINDWGDNGDTPLDAFKRIKDRNYQDLQDAKITWDDYVDNVSDAGETLYDDMKSYSDSWLEHQQKYHNMSIDDYIAGIDREAERLEEFYANDVINYQKYVEEKQALEEKRFDAVAQKNADEYSAWQKDADAWQELRSTYDDWDKYGDSEEDFLKRKIDRVKEFYNAGKISFEEFIDDTNKYSMELYKSQSSAVDELLQKQQDYISNIKDEFSKQEQELRDSWDVADRKTDMSEVQAQLDVYANSVTDKGQQKYKELQEQMKQLQRDEELYQLQKKNNATIESLEAEYKQMEDGKKNILTGLQNADINISAYVATITDKVSATGGNIESLLSRMLDKFDSFKIENNSMSDNRKIINNFMQMTPEEKQDALNKYVGL